MKILRIGCMFVGFLSLVLSLSAQTFTVLHSFDSTDGGQVFGGLVQGANGYFYGATGAGGANNACSGGCGTVFKITATGNLTTLYSFCSQSGCSDGVAPDATLVQDTNGNLYGTTFGGANRGSGTVFKISLGGELTTLYSFCSESGCSDGAGSDAPLVQATNGDLYGTTLFGGSNACSGGCGTVFKITPSGTLTTLHSFDSTDGDAPRGPVQATDGNFYGTTNQGGAHGGGTVFKITPAGKLTTLYNFCSLSGCTDGEAPLAGLVQGTDGNFYGTATQGGANGGGTVFKVTPTGELTTLYSFGGTGGWPQAILVLATDGNFYGTTAFDGTDGIGSIFKITPSGKLTTLHSFDGTDGELIAAPLVQDTNGKFYGTAPFGGANNDGTVFSLSVGLGPFVKTLPAAGKVGAEIGILGTSLTGATGVTFNGTTAQFKVVSPTLILAYVPTGATTGTIKVILPEQTLSSNVPFYVLK